VTDDTFFASHQTRAIADADCSTCHDPHASGREGLLRTNQHAPFASGSCETCHDDLGASTDFAVTGTTDLCQRCHRGTKEFETALFRHNLEEEGSCNQCHNPHASNVDALLTAEPSVMCANCHFDEPEREKPKAAYMTHDSMNCLECHVPHGANNANYLISPDGDFCRPCHEQAHAVTHPVGPEVIDARTGEPVTCLSCHQLHGAEFDWYLPLDPARDLCIQCHRR